MKIKRKGRADLTHGLLSVIFDPPYVHPGKGDIVRFLFNPKKSVACSSSLQSLMIWTDGSVLSAATL